MAARVTLSALIAVVGLLAPLGAQSPAQLKRELDALAARVDAQQKEIDALKPQGGGRAAAPDLGAIALTVDKAPTRGASSSRVVLVEGSDFQCPFCARHIRQTAPLIEKDYVATGKVRHAFVNFPMASHRDAFQAAESGLCANDQSKFWELHDRLFTNQARRALSFVAPMAGALGMKADALKACVESGAKRDHVTRDLAMARSAGVTATPTFFVGLLDARTGAVTVTARIVGAKPYTVSQQALDSALARR